MLLQWNIGLRLTGERGFTDLGQTKCKKNVVGERAAKAGSKDWLRSVEVILQSIITELKLVFSNLIVDKYPDCSKYIFSS